MSIEEYYYYNNYYYNYSWRTADANARKEFTGGARSGAGGSGWVLSLSHKSQKIFAGRNIITTIHVSGVCVCKKKI